MMYTSPMRRLLLGLLLFSLPIVRSASTFSGSTACPASGAKQVRPTSTPAFSYTLYAPTTNTGTINLGGSTVTTSTGVQLQPSGSDHEGASTPIYNLSTVYFACSASGDSIQWKYEQ
jgi:hypothetical protein